MEKTVINIKTDKSLKENAQKVAKKLGFPLGTLVNGYLRQLVRDKQVVFSLLPAPNAATRKILDEARKDIEKGLRNVNGPFNTKDEALEYLDKFKE